MRLEKQKNGSVLKVLIEGRIDTNTAVEFGTSINDSLDDIKELILDFQKVEYLSSIGLRVILEFQKRMNEQGAMKIINVPASVMEIFEMTGFTNILVIE